MGHQDYVIGFFLNPFVDYQLFSFDIAGVIRIWDLQDLGCIKAFRIDGALQIKGMLAHPTEPNVFFVIIATKSENRCSFSLSSLLETKGWSVVQYNIAYLLLCPST